MQFLSTNIRRLEDFFNVFFILESRYIKLGHSTMTIIKVFSAANDNQKWSKYFVACSINSNICETNVS